jgi:hypothetical protein
MDDRRSAVASSHHGESFPCIPRSGASPPSARAIVVTLWSIIPMYVPSYVPGSPIASLNSSPPIDDVVPARPRRRQRVDVPLRDRRLDEHRADAALDEQVDERLDVPHARLALRRDPLDPTTSKPKRRPK